MNKKRLPAIILVVVALLVALPFTALAAEAEDDLAVAKSYVVYNEFFDYDQAVLDAASMDELIAALVKTDVYAKYYTAEQYAAFNDNYDGSFVGIGVALQEREDGAIVLKTVYPGEPAYRAGLRNNDILIAVDEETVGDKTLSEVQSLLRGNGVVGSVVTISVLRGGKLFVCSMPREEINAPSIDYELLADGVGYIAVDQFTVDTADQVKDVLDALRAQGMTSILFDLRDCGGGVMSAAGDAAALLTGEQVIYYMLSQDGYRSVYLSDYADYALGLPLAVLVNEHTASASELLAAVVQDTDAGSVIGAGTYGKGVYQTAVTLPSGGALYFTVGKYLSRGFQDIKEQGGVTPDVLLTDDGEQYAYALNWLVTRQYAARELRLVIGSTRAYEDGTAYIADSAPFISKGSSYIAVRENLVRMGWELYYYNGCWYAFNGVNRLILDLARHQVLSGGHSAELILNNGVSYIPAAFLRYVGCDVVWDGATQAVTISNK